MKKEIQTPEERETISAEWARVGGGFTTPPATHPVMIEDLLVRSIAQASADYRLFFVAATWLGTHHNLVDMRLLGKELSSLKGLSSAVAGALLSVANEIAQSPRLQAAQRFCRPLKEPRPLFDMIAQNPLLTQFAREDSLPLFSQWGLWQEEISLKTDAVMPASWILKNCPELRVRALLGVGLESEITASLLEGPKTIADLARETKAAYASTHEAVSRLIARGIVGPSTDGETAGIALTSSVKQWIQNFPVEQSKPKSRLKRAG